MSELPLRSYHIGFDTIPISAAILRVVEVLRDSLPDGEYYFAIPITGQICARQPNEGEGGSAHS